MEYNEFMEELEYALENRKDPRVLCPCCRRETQIYKRKFSAEMAVFLTRLVRAYKHKEKWYTIPEILGEEQVGKQKVATDGVYLLHWELLVKPTAEEAKVIGGQKGLYRPTDKGIHFVYEAKNDAMPDAFVSPYVYLYDNRAIKWAPNRVTLLQLLPGKTPEEQERCWYELLYG